MWEVSSQSSRGRPKFPLASFSRQHASAYHVKPPFTHVDTFHASPYHYIIAARAAAQRTPPAAAKVLPADELFAAVVLASAPALVVAEAPELTGAVLADTVVFVLFDTVPLALPTRPTP